MSKKYTHFSYNPDDGFLRHISAGDAKDCAQAAIDRYRKQSRDDGEWCSEVDDVYWGVINQQSKAVDIITECCDFVDYTLCDVGEYESA